MLKVDRHTIIQILGGLMNKPDILNDVDKYRLEVQDFSTSLDRFIFSAINNLYNLGEGATVIRAVDIVNYLRENATARSFLDNENGEVYLQDCETQSEPANFAYYYNKLKKINFLRDIQSTGHSIDEFYCEDVLNPKYAEINNKFERMTLEDILNQLRMEVDAYESKYILNTVMEESKATDGIDQLITDLKVKPEVGCKLQGDIINTVCRGGRKGKLYLRSAGSGVGKTRSMVGDACSIAYPVRFDRKQQKWVSTGSAEKVLYIMTEQDPAEIQTMILAYLTGYNEEIFLYGTYGEKEMPRIQQAVDIMKKYEGNMLFARIPDPCASAVKILFRKYNTQQGVENFFYDYIFSSPAMLNEYRDLKLREDVCLRLFTTALKNLAVEMNVFVLTSTQVSNDDDEKGGFRDFHNVQGSKAIVNLCDFACIMSRPTKAELQELKGFESSFSFIPNLVTDVYKNRRGRWNMIRIWSMNDLGSCRKEDLFVTTADMKPIKEFQVVQFDSMRFEDFSELCDLYNTGVVSDSVFEEFYQVSDIKPEDLLEDVEEAFNNNNDNKKRVSKMSFKDFL